MNRFVLAIIGAIFTAVLSLILWWIISKLLFVGPALNFGLGGAIIGAIAGFFSRIEDRKSS